MTRRPSVLTPALLLDAARLAVVTAVGERTVALSQAEAGRTEGGSFTLPGSEPTSPILKPIVAGGIYNPPTLL